MKENLIKTYLTTRRLLEKACTYLNESKIGSRQELVDRIKSHKYSEILYVIDNIK